MPRTRSIRIRESLDELEQLRQYYQGRPQARRLLFLAFLKENKKRTIAEAAHKVGISDRRGRYWWDAYRDDGLQGLLERRVWKMEEKFEEGNSGSVQINVSESQTEYQIAEGIPAPNSLIHFFNAIALNSTNLEQNVWMQGFREALLKLFPDVDYVVMNVRSGIDVLNPSRTTRARIYRQHYVQSEDVKVDKTAVKSQDYGSAMERLIAEGKQRGFPFEKYHYPPTGFDFYLDAGKRGRSTGDEHDSYIGTLLLFRQVEKEAISSATLDVVERLRPFFVFSFADFVARSRLNKPGSEQFEYALQRVADDIELTERECQVVALEVLGHSYQEIASLLHISLSTVQTHIRSVYKKADVNKLSEFFAKYFTPRNFFEGKNSDEIV